MSYSLILIHPTKICIKLVVFDAFVLMLLTKIVPNSTNWRCSHGIRFLSGAGTKMHTCSVGQKNYCINNKMIHNDIKNTNCCTQILMSFLFISLSTKKERKKSTKGVILINLKWWPDTGCTAPKPFLWIGTRFASSWTCTTGLNRKYIYIQGSRY